MSLAELASLFERNRELVLWVSMASGLSLVVGALLGPWLILRLPADYFSAGAPGSERVPGAGRLLRSLFRNVLGMVLVLIGVLLLVLPGQGLLTILAGIIVVDLPFKRAVLRRLTRGTKVRAGLDWYRRRFSREPFDWDEA